MAQPEPIRADRSDMVPGVGLIAVGVPLAFIGVGLLFLGGGSATVLSAAAAAAGVKDPKSSTYAGFLAVVLAALLFCGGALGALALENSAGHVWAIAAGVLSTGLMGAALSPLALAPIAAACGVRGAFGPIASATDVAGAGGLLRLAPLCSLIAIALVVPLPLAPYGIVHGLGQGEPGWWIAGAVSLVIWFAAIPLSAIALTRHFVELRGKSDAPTGIGRALPPLLGALAIGVLALGGSLGTACFRPSFTHAEAAGPSSPWGTPVGCSGANAEWYPEPLRIHPTELALVCTDERLSVEGAGGERLLVSFWSLPTPPTEIIAYARDDGGLSIELEGVEGRRWINVDENGVPEAEPLAERITARIGPAFAVGLTLAVFAFSLALLWLGRIGRSLRLLAGRARFGGTLATHEDDDGPTLVFETDDGAHRARVPVRQVSAPQSWTPAQTGPAVLFSDTPLQPMSFRSAYGPFPPDALVVVGTHEAAVARQVRRARKIAFRLGVVALAGLMTAAVTVVLAL